MSSETSVPDCGQCGAKLRADARFCARCGTRLPFAAQEIPGHARAEAFTEEATPAVDRRQQLRVVGWLYGLMLMISLCFGFAWNIEPMGDFLTAESVVFAILVLAFAVYYRSEIVPLLHPAAFNLDAGRKLAIATAIQFVLLGTVFYLMEKTGIPFERVTDEMQRHDYTAWQLLVLCSLMPAVFEEIAFRGIIFDRLKQVLGEKEAWLVTAALFSVLHLSPVIFPTHFAMGLIFGWLRMRTGSLIPGMILHAAWNAANIGIELWQQG